MTDSVPQASGAAGEPPAQMRMLHLVSGFQLSQAVYVVAKLGIATALLDGPLPADELAARTQTDPAALRRLVRALAAQGLFRRSGDVVELTELGATLADDHPGSVRSVALYWMETHYAAYAELVHTVRTGETAAVRHYGMPFFDWIVADPYRAEIQTQAMAKALDLTMLAMASGKERTEEEYRKLLESAGFVLDRVVPSRTPFSFIEASLR